MEDNVLQSRPVTETPLNPLISMDAVGQLDKKKAGTLGNTGFPAFVGCRWTAIWWRWRESNPRPKALDARYYMLSSPLDLVPRQHDVRSASKDQPA